MAGDIHVQVDGVFFLCLYVSVLKINPYIYII